MYGLKGTIDVSVECKIDQRNESFNFQQLILPLELKSGKQSNSISHKAQLMMYSLLMSDFYNREIPGGLLYYIKDSTMIGVSSPSGEIRGLVIRRNELANFMSNNRLPPMLKQKFTCSNCSLLRTCVLYHRATENGTPDSSGIPDLFLEHSNHLNLQHIQYFLTWDRLIDLERNDTQRMKKEIWSMTSKEREKLGRCFSQMVLENIEFIEKILIYSFIRSPKSGLFFFLFLHSSLIKFFKESFNLLDSQISIGDSVLLSTESGKYGLGVGYVRNLKESIVEIQMEEAIKIPIPTDIEDLFPIRSMNEAIKNYSIQWRIDKDELSSGSSIIKDNLIQLFVSNGDEKRRKLIVDLEAPRFTNNSIDSSLEYLSNLKPGITVSSQETLLKYLDFNLLNIDQRKAAQKVFSALDYALILGMPGTGKTTTLAFIIKVLVSKGKTILLTSYTHNAVDNVLLKLSEIGVDFIRLGRSESIHCKLLAYSIESKLFQTTDEFGEFVNSKQVVATTCLGITHPLFQRKKFDYCIVDEASQITQPICLGPLRFADIFVLVGDHYQLPPLIRNNEARDSGMDLSLFKRLSEAHPQAIVNLEYQYRMNQDIMVLSNALIYNYRLRCGTPAVAEVSKFLKKYLKSFFKKKYLSKRVLHLPHNPISIFQKLGHLLPNWIQHILDPRYIL